MLFFAELKGQNGYWVLFPPARGEASLGALPTGWSLLPQADHEHLTIPMMPSYTRQPAHAAKGAAKYGGFLNATSDTDGVLRRHTADPAQRRYGLSVAGPWR